MAQSTNQWLARIGRTLNLDQVDPLLHLVEKGRSVDDPKESWKEVASRVEALGLKLKMHLEQEQDDQVDDRLTGQTQTALDDLSGRVSEAFDAFGNASRDEAVHADVRSIADLIKAALIKTLRAVGAEVSEIMDQIEDYAEDAADKLTDSLDSGSKSAEIPSDNRNDSA